MKKESKLIMKTSFIGRRMNEWSKENVGIQPSSLEDYQKILNDVDQFISDIRKAKLEYMSESIKYLEKTTN